MNSSNTNTRLPLGNALLSAALAGGISVYSTVANAATDQSQPDTQHSTQTNQAAATERQPGQQDAANSGSSQEQHPQMSQADQNTDAELVWTEIYAIYDDELDEAGWSETYVFETYDQDADSTLNEDEYLIFVSDLADASGEQDTTASSNQGNTDQPSVQNQQATTTDANQQHQQQQQAGAAEQDPEAATAVSVVTISEIALAPSELEGREVVNYNNDEIGDVEQVITTPDGTISGLVVGVGGFWGMGKKDVFVPAAELRAYGDKLIWETFLDEDQLEELPQYEAETYSAAE